MKDRARHRKSFTCLRCSKLIDSFNIANARILMKSDVGTGKRPGPRRRSVLRARYAEFYSFTSR